MQSVKVKFQTSRWIGPYKISKILPHSSYLLVKIYSTSQNVSITCASVNSNYSTTSLTYRATTTRSNTSPSENENGNQQVTNDFNNESPTRSTRHNKATQRPPHTTIPDIGQTTTSDVTQHLYYQQLTQKTNQPQHPTTFMPGINNPLTHYHLSQTTHKIWLVPTTPHRLRSIRKIHLKSASLTPFSGQHPTSKSQTQIPFARQPCSINLSRPLDAAVWPFLAKKFPTKFKKKRRPPFTAWWHNPW